MPKDFRLHDAREVLGWCELALVGVDTFADDFEEDDLQKALNKIFE
jgi:hypothetical protein